MTARAPELVGPGAAPGREPGIPVTRVAPDSRGAKLGLKEGDLILSVDGKDMTDTAALRRAVTEATAPLVIVVRRGAEGEVTLREQAEAAEAAPGRK